MNGQKQIGTGGPRHTGALLQRHKNILIARHLHPVAACGLKTGLQHAGKAEDDIFFLYTVLPHSAGIRPAMSGIKHNQRPLVLCRSGDRLGGRGVSGGQRGAHSGLRRGALLGLASGRLPGNGGMKCRLIGCGHIHHQPRRLQPAQIRHHARIHNADRAGDIHHNPRLPGGKQTITKGGDQRLAPAKMRRFGLKTHFWQVNNQPSGVFNQKCVHGHRFREIQIKMHRHFGLIEMQG